METSAADDFPDAETVIERLGGIRPAAAKLGVPVTTVQGWKNRGRIPENRHAAILEIAARLGIELGRAGEPSTVPNSRAESDVQAETNVEAESGTAKADTTAPPPGPGATAEEVVSAQSPVVPDSPPPNSESVETNPSSRAPLGSGLLWLTLAVALVALGGVALLALRPGIVAKVADSGVADLRGRLDAIEATIGSDVASLKQRVDQLVKAQAPMSSGLADLRAGRTEAEQSATALVERVDSIVPRIEQLEQEITSVAKRLEAVQQRADTVGGEAETGSSEAIASLRADIEALQASIASVNREQANVGKSLSDVAARQSNASGSNMALLLGIGQLEAAVRSGAAYQGALERMRRIAADKSSINETLARLDAWSAKGVPTIAALERRFEGLQPALAVGPTPPGGRDFLDGIWARVKATVSFRRIDSESRSPITLTERALASNDLAAAISATEGFGGKIEKWREAVRAKLESENVLRDLHEQSLAFVQDSETEPTGKIGGANDK